MRSTERRRGSNGRFPRTRRCPGNSGRIMSQRDATCPADSSGEHDLARHHPCRDRLPTSRRWRYPCRPSAATATTGPWNTGASVLHLRDSKGLRYLARLMHRPKERSLSPGASRRGERPAGERRRGRPRGGRAGPLRGDQAHPLSHCAHPVAPRWARPPPAGERPYRTALRRRPRSRRTRRGGSTDRHTARRGVVGAGER